jgi:hypothetical protein
MKISASANSRRMSHASIELIDDCINHALTMVFS